MSETPTVHYEKANEVRDRLTSDELAELVAKLSDYERTQTVLEFAKYYQITITPDILRAFADLAEAIQEANGQMEISGLSVIHHKTQDELEETALTNEASRFYYAERKRLGLS